MASITHENTDPTFGKYTNEQARQYALGRGTSYPAEIYSAILDYHESTGGQMQKMLDVGCGPGKATRDLAPFFDTAIGTDHSSEMINVARSMNYKSKNSPIHFEVATEKDFDAVPGVEPGSVDLITAAMAAHWFDMDTFWPKAAPTLKQGGTVALWTCSSLFCHPSTPNATEVQKTLFELEYDILGPYVLEGNRISQGMYDKLKLPWQVNPAVKAFDQTDFKRVEWDRDGKAEDGKDFLIGYRQSLEDFERSMSTASMVTRWREANPPLVGTEQDCVTQTCRKIKEATGISFGEVTFGHGVVLLLFKKRHE